MTTRFEGAIKFAGIYVNNFISTTVLFDSDVDGTTANNVLPFGAAQNGGVYAGGWIRETRTIDRVFYSEHLDSPTQYSWNGTHRVRQVRSENGFASSQVDGLLNHCTIPTGFLTCAVATPIQAGGRLSVSYAANRSVVAYRHRDHSGDGRTLPADEIRMAIGLISNDTLGEAVGTGRRSAVPPAVACQDNFSGSFDCIVAYVPIDDIGNPLVTRRVEIVQTPNGFSPVLEISAGTMPANTRTANAITAWWSGSLSKFFLAYRAANANQPIVVLSSATGNSWTIESSNFAMSETPPSAATMWRGTDNLMLYSRQ